MLSATRLAQVHHRARVGGRGEHRHLQHRLFDRRGVDARRHRTRVVDFDDLAFDRVDAVLDRRRGRDEAQVELALESLAHDLHVEETEEPAPEAEAQRAGRLGLVRDARIVQAEPLERFPKVRVVVAVDGIEAAEDHRLGVLIALERLAWPRRLGDGLTTAGFADVLDARDQISDLTGFEHRHGRGHRSAVADLVGFVHRVRLQEPQAGTGRQPAVHDPHRADDPAVLIEVRIEDEGLQRGVAIAFRRGDAVDDGIEQLGDALARLRAEPQDLVGWDAQDALDLVGVEVGIGGREIDLVERGHDLEVVLEGEVAVREGLRLDALRRIDDEHDALACRERARHLVAEVDVPRRVDEVQHVVAPLDPDVLGLDRDAPLALEVHGVEVLLAHLSRIDRTGQLQDAIRERGLSVVDVGDDAEVPDAVQLHDLVDATNAAVQTRPVPALLTVAGLGRSGVAGSLDWLNRRDLRGEHQEPEEAQPAEREAGRAQQGSAVRAEDPRQGRGALVERR